MHKVYKRPEELQRHSVSERWPTLLHRELLNLYRAQVSIGASQVAFYMQRGNNNWKCACFCAIFQGDIPDNAMDVNSSDPICLPPIQAHDFDDDYPVMMAKEQGYWIGEDVVIVHETAEGDMERTNQATREALARAESCARGVITGKRSINALMPLFEKRPDLKERWYLPMVRTVEKLAAEADELFDFVNHQKQAHAISIIVDDSKFKGRMTSAMLANIATSLNQLAELIGKQTSGIHVVWRQLLPGSTVIVGDIEAADPDKSITKEDSDRVQKFIRKSFEAAPSLRSDDKGEAAKQFTEAVGGNIEDAAAIAKAVRNIAPDENADGPTVRILLPDEKFQQELRADDRDKMKKAVDQLEEIRKTDGQTTMTLKGELGMLAAWTKSKEHRFQVQDDGRTYTVYYTPSAATDKRVQKSVKKKVKVVVERKDGKWCLKEWLSR